MKIVEIFKSLQGEGISAGRPAIFVRTAGCNLCCPFCDSRYSWDTKSCRTLKPVEVVEEVRTMSPPSLVVLTGGEPLVQYVETLELLALLGECGFEVEVETNGTIFLPSEVSVARWNVSPKLWRFDRYTRTHWEDWAERDNVYLKFVVSSEPEVEKILDEARAHRFPLGRIFLMPLAASRAEYLARAPVVWEWCVKYGVRFSPRLHIALFDTQRGV